MQWNMCLIPGEVNMIKVAVLQIIIWVVQQDCEDGWWLDIWSYLVILQYAFAVFRLPLSIYGAYNLGMGKLAQHPDKCIAFSDVYD